jgi:hypothetical protein
MTKPQPKWVEQRKQLQEPKEEILEFIGKTGADGVIDGLLPNGEPYLWYKRRVVKDTKYKGRKV